MSRRGPARARRDAREHGSAAAHDATGSARTGSAGMPYDAKGSAPTAHDAPAGRRGRRRFHQAALEKVPLPLRGLRSRLVVAFVLVTMAGALSTGAVAFREARTGVLQQSQDAVIRQFRAGVNEAALNIPLRPGQSDLDAAVNHVQRANQSQQWRVMATYGDLRAWAVGAQFDMLSPELRRSVATKRAAVFQRVNADGRPWLVVGLPVTYDSGEAKEPTLSGLVMYLAVPQDTEQAYVEAMVSAIEHATLVALGLAVVLALLAASGVLRPVRALRGATRRMAEGHLDVRLAVTGTDELADLSQSFNHTAAALERSVAELRRMEAQARRFVADVSHELRTPLAAMSAVTDVLDENALRLDRETGEALRLVSEGTSRLSVLVNDLMEISRFDAGAAELNVDEIDLADFVQHTLAARGWQGGVETHLPPPGTLRARVDPRRLDVVLANLVGNALRHGEPPVRLTVGVREDPAGVPWAVIEVADNGPGIAEEAMPHIFERFYKASSSRTRSESSGLGLAITAENVRLHGGRVSAANLLWGGAAFTVELPLHGAPGDPAADDDAGAR
ncbi:sensor histidine kinase [Streptomyces sp. NPDC008238]